MGRFTRFKGGQSVTEGSGASSSLDERQFVFDADFDKNDSGEIISPTTGVEGNIYITTSTITSSVTITFTNFPGQTEDLVLEGNPEDSIIGTKSVTWEIDAPSGQGFLSAPTQTGVPDGFGFTANALSGAFNTAAATDARLTVSFLASTFPDSNVVVDYNNISISTSPANIVTYSHTFTGGVSGSPSCTTLAGNSCSVGVSISAPAFEYYTTNNACSVGCSKSINSSGGSTSCNPSTSTASQSASISVISIPTYQNPDPIAVTWESAMYCATVNTGSASSICRGFSVETKRPGQNFSGGGTNSSSCGSAPSAEIGGGSANGYRLIGRDLGDDNGTWEGRVRDGFGQVRASGSASTSA